MSNPDPMLEALLKAIVDSGSSDLHLTVGRPATALATVCSSRTKGSRPDSARHVERTPSSDRERWTQQ